MMSAPVLIQSDIGYTCDTDQFLGFYECEELLPHGCKIDQVPTLTEVFLCNLQFCHLRCFLHVTEDRCVWFAGLEIEWTVLGLQNDVIAEFTIEFSKLTYSLIHAVFTMMFGTIYERAPDDDTLIWS